jgi:hypothetical protein
MGLMQRLFERKQTPSKISGPAAATPQRDEIRRELLNLAVRETLRKHGIPQSWIQADMRPALTTQQLRGIHLRLLVREWQPDLLSYTVGLQRAIQARLLRLDPLSIGWMAGISWQYDPVDDSTCPSLPPPDHWSNHRHPVYSPNFGDDGQHPRWLASSGSQSEDCHDFRATEPMEVL